MDENSLATAAAFSFPYEAQIAKATLEAAGIPAFVADEHTVNMQWLYSDAVGGVRVQVPRKYLSEAQQVLEIDYSGAVESEFEAMRCCNCGSLNLTPYTQGKKPAFLIFLLLGFPLFFYKHGYKCQDCGEFQQGQE